MGWGSSMRKGGGRRVRALPRKFVFLGFGRGEPGISQKFCRDVPDPCRCSKSLCQKKFVRIFHSLYHSGKKKAHEHKPFGPVAVGTTPGLSQGGTGFVLETNPLCPRDKCRLSPYFAQWKPGLFPSVPLGQSRDEWRQKTFMC